MQENRNRQGIYEGRGRAGIGRYRSFCRVKFRSQEGLTLTELLASVMILGMIGLVLGGGVMMVKSVYQKTQEKANAEQVLSMAAQLMTDEFANALEVKGATSGSGTLAEPTFRSGNNHLWVTFAASSDDGTGIEKWYGEAGRDRFPLVAQTSAPDGLYTDFDEIRYSEESACFTVINLAVYRKTEETAERLPVAELPLLTVRAVNLDRK